MRKDIVTKELVDARKTRLGPKEARALLAGADELVAAKGKKIERVDLRNGLPDKATVARLMIGPSGNLRAPTLRVVEAGKNKVNSIINRDAEQNRAASNDDRRDLSIGQRQYGESNNATANGGNKNEQGRPSRAEGKK